MKEPRGILLWVEVGHVLGSVTKLTSSPLLKKDIEVFSVTEACPLRHIYPAMLHLLYYHMAFYHCFTLYTLAFSQMTQLHG